MIEIVWGLDRLYWIDDLTIRPVVGVLPSESLAQAGVGPFPLSRAITFTLPGTLLETPL